MKNIAPKNEILALAEKMTANDFLLEFASIITIDEMENLLDPNEGMANLIVEVDDDGKTEDIALLFIGGEFDSYSYCS